MASRGEESRRFPRVVTRCRVRLRDRFGVWDAETEDVGPRGCRIVTRRPQTVGALVSLTLESDRVAEVLDVAGQIVWSRTERSARAGVSFAGGAAPGALAPGAWFESLTAALNGPDIVIEIDAPTPDGDPLPVRLLQRGQELLVHGEAAAAEIILRRALSLAPGDEALEAALRALHAR